VRQVVKAAVLGLLLKLLEDEAPQLKIQTRVFGITKVGNNIRTNWMKNLVSMGFN
jgi:hypothetical protein